MRKFGKKIRMARTGFFIRQKKKGAVLIDKKRNRETNIEIRWLNGMRSQKNAPGMGAFCF